VLGQDALRRRPFVFYRQPILTLRFKHLDDGKEYIIENATWVRVIDRYVFNEQTGRVQMGSAARNVLFNEPSDACVRFQTTEERDEVDKALHIESVINECESYEQRSRESKYKNKRTQRN